MVIENNLEGEEKSTTLLIACYEAPYSDASLEIIKGKIKREEPTKIVILKIIEEPKIREKLNSRIGKKSEEDVVKYVVEDKKKKVDKYAEDILEITDETDIPTEVRVRKTEVIADEIIKDFEEMNIDHLILHDEDRGLLDRLAKGKVKEEVKKQIGEDDITVLD